MDSSPDKIITEIFGIIRVFEDGSFQKLTGTETVPAGVDPSTGVQSKDIVISPETPLSVRVYIPKTQNSTTKKLPILIYFHGGGFIIETAASPKYHNFLNLVSSESNVVIVSVDYRTAPEHYIPACYDDSWEAIKWVGLHVNGNGPDPWLNEYPDLGNMFFGGDSAGGNIAHQMAIRVGSGNPDGNINLQGMILLHPYFWGKDRIGSESVEHQWTKFVNVAWVFANPGTSGMDDPLINPDMDPKVSDSSATPPLVFGEARYHISIGNGHRGERRGNGFRFLYLVLYELYF